MIPIQGQHREYGLLQLHGRPGLDSVQVILGHEASLAKYSVTAYRQDVRNMHFKTKIILQYNSQQLGIINKVNGIDRRKVETYEVSWTRPAENKLLSFRLVCYHFVIVCFMEKFIRERNICKFGYSQCVISILE